MIVLDTNVVSAMMSPAPPSAVIAWVDRQVTAMLYLSTVTVAEIAFGLRALPEGRRQRELGQRFAEFVEAGFQQRVLDFDLRSAWQYGEVLKIRRDLGRPLGVPDGQIAAIARANGMAVATRNVRDFEECGLEVLNPFAPGDQPQ